LGAIGLSLFPHLTWAKESETNKKINFIRNLVEYGREHLELDLKKEFFVNWADDEDLNYFLYLSSTTKIEAPKGVKNYISFENDKELAQKTQREYIKKGFHTLLYTRTGKHQPELTNNLLSYSNEAIAFNTYHEATHIHLQKHAKISTKLEEAACDVMGTFGAKFYAERNKDLDLKLVETQNLILENANKEINKYAALITDNSESNDKIHRKLERKLFKLFKDSDNFFKNRFIHPVNNAYLLMMLNYCSHYELMKQVAIKDVHINTFIYTLENLSKNEEKAILKLKEKLATTTND
jgi:hypothetical protein